MLGIFGRHDDLCVWPTAFNQPANVMPGRRADAMIWLHRKRTYSADGAASAVSGLDFQQATDTLNVETQR